MATNRKYLALINPISGTGKKDYLPEVLRNRFEGLDLTIRFTQRANHAYDLAKQAAADKFYAVIAIGGDGTVNEVASALCHTETRLGIIPNGSGNGLARHLRIPMATDKAIDVILDDVVDKIDHCTANSHPFFCTCGVGFDAQVSEKFAKSKRRGPLSYVKSAIGEYLRYRSQRYKITTPDGIITERAFLIACGNASQYGNNAYIAPNADMHDGLIDVTVVLPITPLDTAVLGILLFSKHIDQDTNIISFRTPSLTIEREREGILHLDGEPVMTGKTIEIICHPQSLNVFTALTPQSKSNIFTTIESSFWDFISSIRSELNV